MPLNKEMKEYCVPETKDQLSSGKLDYVLRLLLIKTIELSLIMEMHGPDFSPRVFTFTPSLH